MNSKALIQIENLTSEENASILSILENLERILLKRIFVANSLTLKGKIFVLAANNKVIKKINIRNNHIDNEDFKNIKEDKNRLINPFLENVK